MPTVGSAVMLTGTSYESRDAVKAIGGGVWVKPWNAWLFPEEKRAAVEAFAQQVVFVFKLITVLFIL